jgi:hypothetical protein
VSPIKVYKRLAGNIEELLHYSKFRKIILELNKSGKLDEAGIKVDENSNMYIGVDLNPELLLYSDTSQESVELRMISEKMNKYNDFLTKEGILDSIKLEYERVLTDSFYGYVLQIGYNFKRYKRAHLIYDTSYFLLIATGLAFFAKALM